jgi:hypothetical protein
MSGDNVRDGFIPIGAIFVTLGTGNQAVMET